MNNIISGFLEKQNTEGQKVIEFRAPIGFGFIPVAIAPALIIAATAFFTGTAPTRENWEIYGAAVMAFLLGIPVAYLLGWRAHLRITFERTTGRVLTFGDRTRREWPASDIESAFLESRTLPGGGESYRLVFRLKNGETANVTDGYYGFFGAHDREQAVAAINRELAASRA